MNAANKQQVICVFFDLYIKAKKEDQMTKMIRDEENYDAKVQLVRALIDKGQSTLEDRRRFVNMYDPTVRVAGAAAAAVLPTLREAIRSGRLTDEELQARLTAARNLASEALSASKERIRMFKCVRWGGKAAMVLWFVAAILVLIFIVRSSWKVGTVSTEQVIVTMIPFLASFLFRRVESWGKKKVHQGKDAKTTSEWIIKMISYYQELIKEIR